MEVPIDDTILNDDDWLALFNLDFDGPLQHDFNHYGDNTFANASTSSDQAFDYTSDIFSAPTLDPHFQSLFDVDGSTIGTTAIEDMVLPESTAPNNDRREVHDDDLAEKFDLALQAVEKNNKRKALHADIDNNDEEYTTKPKFRIELPENVGKTDVSRPKHKRLKRSEQRACLLCRFFKRKCSPGQNCARCLERGLGQRDLDYTYCLRDNPVKFNPFSIEAQHPSISYIKDLRTTLPFLILHFDIYHAAKTKSDFSLAIVSSNISALRSGRSVHGSRHLTEPYVTQYLEVEQSRVSTAVFERLEGTLRQTNLDQREAERNSTYRLALAIYLYSWFCYSHVTRNVASNTEADVFCKQYLREYIYLLLNKSQASRLTRNITLQEFVESGEPGRKNEVLDRLVQQYNHTLPETGHMICHHAMKGATELASAMFRAISKQVSISSDWAKLLGDYPQSDNPAHVLGVWSLFWQKIPEFLRHCLCYTEIQFLRPLLHYGCDNRLSASPKLFPEKSWQEWQEEAEVYQDFLFLWMYRAALSEELSTKETSLIGLLLSTWQVPFLHGRHLLSFSSKNVPPRLNGAIRWMILFALQGRGLIDAESILDYCEEMRIAADTLSFKYLSAGFDLFCETLKI